MKFILTSISVDSKKQNDNNPDRNFRLKSVSVTVALGLESDGDMSELWNMDKAQADDYLAKAIRGKLEDIELTQRTRLPQDTSKTLLTPFEKTLYAWDGFLKYNGYLIPQNTSEFFQWYCEVHCPGTPLTTETMNIKIDPSLFKEFSQYKKNKNGY